MIPAFPSKDPDGNLRYYFDWRKWLAVEDGGPIIDFEIAVDSGDDGALRIGDFAQGIGTWAGVIMVWLSGGTEFVTYTVRCRVTLEDGTVEDASRKLTIEAA